MLNWIAIYGAQYLFELNGPLQGPLPDVPQSAEVADSSKLPAVWGVLQPLHAGIFLALAALVVYAVLINRTVFGYEVRAVGHNADAARYGGIPVARSYMATLAIGGAFAGLAGACDVLGWEFHIVTNDIAVSQVGFIGIAVALLGRNSAVGHRVRGAALRRAPGRHVVAGPRPERVPAPARRQPGDHHPGPDHPLRRRPAPAGVRMAGAAAPAGGAAADHESWSRRRRDGARPHPARRPGRRDPGDRRRPRRPRAGAPAAPGAGGSGAGRARPGRAGVRDLGAHPRRAQARPVDALRRGRGDGVRDLGAGQERHVDRRWS